MAGVNELIKRLERFAAGQVKQQIASKVRGAAHDQCLECFRQQRDPYGAPWAPRKKPPDWAIRAFGLLQTNHKLLDYTGNGINSLRSVALSGGSVQLRIINYMKFHQTGTYKMVARKYFPDPTRGLGLWGRPVNDAALEAVREMIRNG